jgi:FHS family L-fucose permease-like MFS transporter
MNEKDPNPYEPNVAKTTDAADASSDKLVPTRYLFPFILVTSLFALWGFANDITNPMVKAFGDIFQITNAEASRVQLAFYGGYGLMAIPAALVLRKLSYKSGILIGLLLYVIGALLFIPATHSMQFMMILIAYFILTCGLAFLETAANPYILSMGPPESATQRLNLCQAFNPMGSLTGMAVASYFILPNLLTQQFRSDEMEAHPEYATMAPAERDGLLNGALKSFSENSVEKFQEMQIADLATIRTPYVILALVVLAVLVLFLVSKLPNTGDAAHKIKLGTLVKKLFTLKYIGGVIAQAFYVGAQIMCWTFIIHYGVTLCGLTAASAQNHNIVAMVIFLSSRFICTFLMRYISPALLMALLASLAAVLVYFTLTLQNMTGLYCLVATSACMSLCFPTIYGIALDGLTPEDAKLGSAGLIMAIVGGAIMPGLQGALMDAKGVSWIENLVGPIQQALSPEGDPVGTSFVLPFLCFLLVAFYGFINIRRTASA